MGTLRDDVLEILRHNVGFDCPEAWVDYAIENGFRRVDAQPLPRCPDCGSEPAGALGQYVYYSTLVHLRRCGRCGLYWSDARIDPALVRRHFDAAYKDEVYYEVGRRLVFDQLAALVARLAPEAGSVLDVGGAKGHLMARVARRRPDLALAVSDLSPAACEAAASRFGLRAIEGGVEALEKESRPYDVVVMSDVLYYEPEIARLWAVLPKIVSGQGAAILRVPNKLLLVRLGRLAARLAERLVPRRPSSGGPPIEDRIRFFNPEHSYLFTRRYLSRRLASIGFASVDAIPTPPLAVPGSGLAAAVWFGAARVVSALSAGAIVLTPSVVVVARRGARAESPTSQPASSRP